MTEVPKIDAEKSMLTTINVGELVAGLDIRVKEDRVELMRRFVAAKRAKETVGEPVMVEG